jgi:hypothetical protein
MDNALGSIGIADKARGVRLEELELRNACSSGADLDISGRLIDWVTKAKGRAFPCAPERDNDVKILLILNDGFQINFPQGIKPGTMALLGMIPRCRNFGQTTQATAQPFADWQREIDIMEVR